MVGFNILHVGINLLLFVIDKYHQHSIFIYIIILLNRIKMIKNEHLPHNITENRIDITFCGKGKCKCPAISMDINNDKVIIGGDDEGYTEFTKEEFKLFVEEVKNGTFDTLIG
jgi:hypothetical protein